MNSTNESEVDGRDFYFHVCVLAVVQARRVTITFKHYIGCVGVSIVVKELFVRKN